MESTTRPSVIQQVGLSRVRDITTDIETGVLLATAFIVLLSYAADAFVLLTGSRARARRP